MNVSLDKEVHKCGKREKKNWVLLFSVHSGSSQQNGHSAMG